VETRTIIAGMGSPSAKSIYIGDNSIIGGDCRILLPVLKVGDYVRINNHTLINGRNSCAIGHNCFIGQNNVLNSEENLIIGNNVCLGTYTSVWTHAYFGELLEGCNLFRVTPTVIEDNAWIMGSYTAIAPGVHVGERAMVLNNSLVTKDVPPNRCVSGIPAVDVTEKMTPYRAVTLDEKYEMMKDFVSEFVRQQYPDSHRRKDDGFKISNDSENFEILFADTADDGNVGEDADKLVITKKNEVKDHLNRVSIFDLGRKTYTKRLTEPEIELIRFLRSYRARFVPESDPRVEL